MKRFRLIRYAFYVLVIAVLFLLRGTSRLEVWKNHLFGPVKNDLVLSGTELAPELIQHLTTSYRRDYPEIKLEFRGGGSARALDDLLHGDADVAFLIRPPLPREQEIFRAATGDSVDYQAIALGGIALLRNTASQPAHLRPQDLRTLLGGQSTPGSFRRVYAPDPNSGLWTAFEDQLYEGGKAPEWKGKVVFLADEESVVEAILNDPEAMGVVSTLNTHLADLPEGIGTISLRVDAEGPNREPLREEIADGSYPFYHYLYAGLRGDGNVQARKFLSYLSSDSGQRGVERAGYLPQRRVLREVHLSRKAIGEK
jgi:ABC-type phosphate transport system substrate-binding protein